MKRLFIEETSKFNPRIGKKHKPVPINATIGADTVFEVKTEEFVLPKKSKTINIFLLGAILLFFSLVFGAKSFVLQIIQGDRNFELSGNNRLRKVSIQPERGVIYDRTGNIIVRNKPSFSIEMNLDVCSQGKSNPQACVLIAQRINDFVKLDLSALQTEINSLKSAIILASGLTKDDLLKLEANISDFPGVSIVTTAQRNYLYADAFAHVIGYVGLGDTLYPTIVGKTGIEQYYDNYLAGISGSQLVQVNSSGTFLKPLSEEKAIAGKDITLYIDLPLQQKAYELLKKAVEDKKAAAGSIVATDPQTGGVLALVSYPSFDPNKLSLGISAQELNMLNNDPTFPFFNRAISAAYPPGSTFKMMMASAALSEKIITEHTLINDPGYIQIGSYTFRNWKADGHGEVDVRKALQVSNDTFFYTIGGGYDSIGGLGIEKISRWANAFGYSKETGIDINGEDSGYIPDSKSRQWYLGDTYITSIGQGDDLATLLQVNNVTQYFANGGKVLKPQIVKQIFGEKEYTPQVMNADLVSKDVYTIVREGMNMAVSPGGTGYPFFDFPAKHKEMKVAGKTGTSEYINSKGELKTHALFTVFGPYDDKNAASISLTVFLEAGGSGADDAAPIARELMDVWFTETH